MSGVAQSRVDKHIAYWLSLPDREKEKFRREWPWLAEMYDAVVHKYVGNDIGRYNSYLGLARAAQINDHMAVCDGSLPEIPSLSRRKNATKGVRYHLKKEITQSARIQVILAGLD